MTSVDHEFSTRQPLFFLHDTTMAASTLLRRTLFNSTNRFSRFALQYSSSIQCVKVIPLPTQQVLSRRQFSLTRTVNMAPKSHFLDTSGESDAVWVHLEPYSNRPQFKPLTQDIKTSVCVIGSGITGITTSYELVKRGVQVVMLEAREVLSGETGDS